MARRNTQTLDQPAQPAVPKRISLRTLAWLMPTVLMALLGLGTLIALAIVPDTAPAVQPFDSAQGEPFEETQGEPEQQTGTGTGAEEIVPVDENPPVQSEPEGNLPEAVEFPPLPVVEPTLLLEWETFLGDPGLSPTPQTRNYYGWDVPARSNSPTEGGVEVAMRILPGLRPFVERYREMAQSNVAPVWLNIDRDGRFIFATIYVLDDHKIVEMSMKGEMPEVRTSDPSHPLIPVGYSYVFLSTDGGKTWEPANQVPRTGEGVPVVPTMNTVRIKAQEGTLVLYQQDKPFRWWVATIELP